MTDADPDSDSVAWLRTAAAVRQRCAAVHARGLLGELEHFEVQTDRMSAVVDEVLTVTRQTYPKLDIPMHSRAGHFDAGGVARLAELRMRLAGHHPDELARALVDLTVVSVLLDAGAGASWRYLESQTGQAFTRSEGLAIASLRAFEVGLFSRDPAEPYRVDGERLQTIQAVELRDAFTADDQHPLAGLAGRVELMHRLGAALLANPCFGGTGRPSGFLGALPSMISAADLLVVVLQALAEIWPGRLRLHGESLGDVWRHPDVGLVPLHKLSQWLTYSLVEPLRDASVEVRELDGLTGLAEYRNGGLLVDLGLLQLRDPADQRRVHAVDDPLVVEWRALTVACLDEIAEHVRSRLGLDAQALPLCKVLEGGTWRAGRVVARRLRPDGSPPLRIDSDGTVF